MSVKKFVAICAAALLLNLIGSLITKLLGLPIFFDTSGTIFIAALGSYMPGIAVGFLTNLLKAPFDPMQMYFSSISHSIRYFISFCVKL